MSWCRREIATYLPQVSENVFFAAVDSNRLVGILLPKRYRTFRAVDLVHHVDGIDRNVCTGLPRDDVKDSSLKLFVRGGDHAATRSPCGSGQRGCAVLGGGGISLYRVERGGAQWEMVGTGCR
jgi:hypothetical protein